MKTKLKSVNIVISFIKARVCVRYQGKYRNKNCISGFISSIYFLNKHKDETKK